MEYASPSIRSIFISRHRRSPLMLLTILALFAVAAATLLCCASAAHAALTPDQQTVILQEAQQAYARGIELRQQQPDQAAQSFRQAAQRYQQLLNAGIDNGYLHYNLGNAYLQLDDIGRAIFHYRIAAQYIGGDQRLRHNLEYARSLREDVIEPTGTWQVKATIARWNHALALPTRLNLFIISWIVLWAAVMTALLNRRPLTCWLVVVLAALSLLLGGSVAFDTVFDTGLTSGVIVTDSVTARQGNGPGYGEAFDQPLHAGTEFDIIERRGDWINIELPNGATGWIPVDAAALFRQ